MIYKLLYQIDDKRHSKEQSLKTRGLNATQISAGIIIVVVGVLFLAYTGLMAAVAGQSDSPGSESGSAQVITIYGSISSFFGVSGFMLILIAVISRRKFSRDIETDETEYQKLRLQVIDLLESPQGICCKNLVIDQNTMVQNATGLIP